jgi:hypothetical protein
VQRAFTDKDLHYLLPEAANKILMLLTLSAFDWNRRETIELVKKEATKAS